MNIVMTLMVRDEADIVSAMLAHHQQQGVDHVVVTDNASSDGTVDILRDFERDGFVTIWHDPEHRKQQYRAVTKMARFAATELGADWVINADADEFWVSTGTGDLRSALASIPAALDVVSVPVVNLTGGPAKDGSGLARLILRDLRAEPALTASGIPFHPTPNALHRAHPEVQIAQGNHRADAPGWAPLSEFGGIEVLHLPWRSWRQYEHKVRVSGEAYLANPTLKPSPKHHGMQDFRRLQDGRLEATYVAKHPSPDEIRSGLDDGSFVEERRLDGLHALRLVRTVDDLGYPANDEAALRSLGRQFRALELRGEEETARIQEWHDLAVGQRDDAYRRIEELSAELEELRARRTVRTVDAISRRFRFGSGRG